MLHVQQSVKRLLLGYTPQDCWHWTLFIIKYWFRTYIKAFYKGGQFNHPSFRDIYSQRWVQGREGWLLGKLRPVVGPKFPVLHVQV